jgi:hypothetical protein
MLTPVAAGQEPASPFEMVRFQGAAPEVLVNGAWWKPLRIGGVTLDALLAHAVQEHGKRWDKRFCEDLPLLLTEMGSAPGASVELVLADLKTGAQKTFPDVALSHEHRQRIRRAEPRATMQPWALSPRVQREHATKPDPRLLHLAVRFYDAARRNVLTAEHAAADLDQLEWALENQFSYLTRLGVDYRAALDTIRASLGDGIDERDFHIQLRKVVALFGDGHSRVRGVEGVLHAGCLPFAVADIGGRLAALPSRGGKSWRATAPWLTAIDDLPVARWLDAAGDLATKGSPQLQRRERLRFLPYVTHLRAALGRPAQATVNVTIGGQTFELPLADKASRAELPLPGNSHGKLAGNIGYLRLAEMSADAAQTVEAALTALRDTRGLVLDVRDNGGGTREALCMLLPAILPKGPPRVVNVAALRLSQGVQPLAEGHLADRYLFPATASGWTEPERHAIAMFAKTFTPAWQFPAEQFSPWHYMVMSADAEGLRYEKPIVVLMNEGCFSATDIFLCALQGLPQVTLLGTPSSGGSGRAREVRLAHSDIAVMLSTMASFQPSGALLEGEGVLPAVLHPAKLEDYLGSGDSALEQAVALLRR